MKSIFALNLIFSIPLTAYPANFTLEKILFLGHRKSKKRQILKNLSRLIVVLTSFGISNIVKNLISLRTYVSIIGFTLSFPLTFFIPLILYSRLNFVRSQVYGKSDSDI